MFDIEYAFVQKSLFMGCNSYNQIIVVITCCCELCYKTPAFFNFFE